MIFHKKTASDKLKFLKMHNVTVSLIRNITDMYKNLHIIFLFNKSELHFLHSFILKAVTYERE